MLKAENLSKDYNGVAAVSDLSFNLEKGEVLGLIGPNGAGKSTTIGMCSGLVTPDSGRIFVEDQELRSSVGIAPQDISVEAKITAEEFLETLKIINESEVSVEQISQEIRFDSFDKYVSELSGGQRKKLSIASAVIKDPEFILLDEPDSGLDVHSRYSLEDIVDKLSKDKGVLVSTHDMAVAERLCDRVVIIEEGEKIVEGDVNELLSEVDASYIIRGEGKIPQVEEEIIESDNSFEIFTDSPHKVLKKLVETDQLEEIENLTVEKPSLEDVFLKLTGRKYEKST